MFPVLTPDILTTYLQWLLAYWWSCPWWHWSSSADILRSIEETTTHARPKVLHIRRQPIWQSSLVARVNRKFKGKNGGCENSWPYLLSHIIPKMVGCVQQILLIYTVSFFSAHWIDAALIYFCALYNTVWIIPPYCKYSNSIKFWIIPRSSYRAALRGTGSGLVHCMN